ncbi:hypothetical protein F511_36120 [Dorcoceras hygrometricum]|uniref:Uncharacterized protein n=1 Tax=Dorcoceras hygrometricum TaxID=472368 RepID=A0A2Z7BER2_9LAMI|nr:hypothetical protein F511_36120 [Dorcoceras hygrometricum]
MHEEASAAGDIWRNSCGHRPCDMRGHLAASGRASCAAITRSGAQHRATICAGQQPVSAAMCDQRTSHRARLCAREEGAAIRGGAATDATKILIFVSEKSRQWIQYDNNCIEGSEPGSDTTVGEPWWIRIPSPGEAAEE